MTNQDLPERYLNRDWGGEWDSLPDAPDLVPRPKAAQITLRLPATLVTEAKRIGAVRGIPYHVLVRGWMLDRTEDASELVDRREAHNTQVNIKLTNEQLDDLKRVASRLRRPYHRVARDRIRAAIEREGATLDAAAASRRPSLQDLTVLLLHQRGPGGSDAIRGMTRLQKLLFVLEQELGSRSAFIAYKYGPFSNEVLDTVEALRIAGFIGRPRAHKEPSFADMVAQVEHRAGPRTGELETFELTPDGHEAAERLRQSNAHYVELFEAVGRLRREWDVPLDELVERVYERYPDYTQNSLIRDEVAARAKRRTPKA